MRYKVYEILLVIIAVLITISISELFLRAFIGPPAKYLYSGTFHDIQNNWSEEYKVDKYGRRINCYNGNYNNKIAVIGDSFTYGQGIPNCKEFVSLLSKNSSKYSYDNYGLIGIGINEYILIIRDLINNEYESIIILFYGNDISDLKHIHKRSYLGKLADNSSFFSLIRKFKRSILVKYTLASKNIDNKNNIFNNTIATLNLDSNYYYETVNPKERELNEFKKSFNSLSKLIHEKGIKNVYIAVVPNGEILSFNLYKYIKKNGGKTEKFKIIPPSYDFIKMLALKNNFIFIETFDEFSINSDNYYFLNDVHWNTNGHHLMSEILLNNIK